LSHCLEGLVKKFVHGGRAADPNLFDGLSRADLKLSSDEIGVPAAARDAETDDKVKVLEAALLSDLVQALKEIKGDAIFLVLERSV
jgi:hypothetical protein